MYIKNIIYERYISKSLIIISGHRRLKRTKKTTKLKVVDLHNYES